MSMSSRSSLAVWSAIHHVVAVDHLPESRYLDPAVLAEDVNLADIGYLLVDRSSLAFHW
jgi:hypothetical protein